VNFGFRDSIFEFSHHDESAKQTTALMKVTAWDMGLRMLRQGAIITVGAVVLGLSLNALREERLSILATWSGTPWRHEAFEERFIRVEKAQELFPLKEAVFVDARPRELYEQGHITGARNLPLESFEDEVGSALGDIPSSVPLIVYVEGTDSTPGIELAQKLRSRTYRNVQVLEKGLDLWMAHGLPVEAVLFDNRQQ
jgi:rhodanese-related sulfurtransferase